MYVILAIAVWLLFSHCLQSMLILYGFRVVLLSFLDLKCVAWAGGMEPSTASW